MPSIPGPFPPRVQDNVGSTRLPFSVTRGLDPSRPRRGDSCPLCVVVRKRCLQHDASRAAPQLPLPSLGGAYHRSHETSLLSGAGTHDYLTACAEYLHFAARRKRSVRGKQIGRGTGGVLLIMCNGGISSVSKKVLRDLSHHPENF